MGTIIYTCPNGHQTTARCRCRGTEVQHRPSSYCGVKAGCKAALAAESVIPVPVPETHTYNDLGHTDIEVVDPLTAFMADMEDRNFRTNSDTGANSNALSIWNSVRAYAGYKALTRDDLRMRQVKSSQGRVTLEELREFDKQRDDERMARYRKSNGW